MKTHVSLGALRVGAVVLALLIVGGLLTAGSASATGASLENQAMEGSLRILPGDWVAAGYIVRVIKPHPDITVKVVNPEAVLRVRCEGATTIQEIRIPLAGETYTVARDIDTWRVTTDTNDADGYYGGVRVPALCGATGAMLSDSTTRGATFRADIQGSFASDVEVKFHYRVPRAKGLANVNCADQGVNPSPGLSACTGKWSSAVRVRASGIWTPTPTATRTPLPTSTPTITPVPTRTPVPTPTEVEGKPTIPPQVYGWVYADLDGDGVRDGLGGQVGAEPGIQGVLIQVLKLDTDEVVASQLSWTDQPPLSSVYYKGYFNINVPEGTFRVRQTLIAGYTLTTPNDVVVTVVEDYPGVVNFGYQPAP